MQSNKLTSALASVGRRFLGTPERRRAKYLATSQYYATNGDREIRRRLRQEIRALAKRAIEVLPSGAYVSVWDQLNVNEEYTRKFQTATREKLLHIRDNLAADLKGASDVS